MSERKLVGHFPLGERNASPVPFYAEEVETPDPKRGEAAGYAWRHIGRLLRKRLKMSRRAEVLALIEALAEIGGLEVEIKSFEGEEEPEDIANPASALAIAGVREN